MQQTEQTSIRSNNQLNNQIRLSDCNHPEDYASYRYALAFDPDQDSKPLDLIVTVNRECVTTDPEDGKESEPEKRSYTLREFVFVLRGSETMFWGCFGEREADRYALAQIKSILRSGILQRWFPQATQSEPTWDESLPLRFDSLQQRIHRLARGRRKPVACRPTPTHSLLSF